ncbi:hypothetical protein LMG7974_00766 [Campylobacter majalis]|uniref:HDOD domain-containing protein n=1 Tax=Campylobacter majalis TaxID=2790656 RepID=A0ABM8Q535_9BACT|nr:HDOD domain-containing protein [Campylobacter majalis]CAD7287898.1 hypothetical protein LMG7974_00766 [Campylobacter majalis]
MQTQLKNSIKTLPPLPETYHKIQQVSDDSGLDEIAKIIENDPLIAVDFLKMANSPLYGFKRQIKTILQAVSLFGKTMSRSLVISSSIKSALKIDLGPYGINTEKFAEISSLQAAFAKEWFKLENQSKSDDLFIVALLQDTGKILIANELVKINKGEMFEADLAKLDIDEVEIKYMGITSPAISAEIFEHWEFEPSISQNIMDSTLQTQSNEIANALKVIREIINIKECFSQKGIQNALNLAKIFGFSQTNLLNTIKTMQER